MFDALKPVFASRTVWANIIGFIAFLLTSLGFGADVLGDQGKLADAALAVVTGLSFIASTAFRIAATHRLA